MNISKDSERRDSITVDDSGRKDLALGVAQRSSISTDRTNNRKSIESNSGNRDSIQRES